MTEYKIPINAWKDCIIKIDNKNTEILFRCCGQDRYLFSINDFKELLPIARLILLIAREKLGYKSIEARAVNLRLIAEYRWIINHLNDKTFNDEIQSRYESYLLQGIDHD